MPPRTRTKKKRKSTSCIQDSSDKETLGTLETLETFETFETPGNVELDGLVRELIDTMSALADIQDQAKSLRKQKVAQEEALIDLMDEIERDVVEVQGGTGATFRVCKRLKYAK